MTDHIHVFGYGSLVDQRTHAHPLAPEVLDGWTRIWREVAGRDFAILSVTPQDGVSLQGAIMQVPPHHLPALDAREAMYKRTAVDLPQTVNAVTYEVQPHLPRATKPILRSYLDVVLSGYETMFGANAAETFYATTHGWDVGLLDDRAAPIYPRHQHISTATAERFDALHRDLAQS